MSDVTTDETTDVIIGRAITNKTSGALFWCSKLFMGVIWLILNLRRVPLKIATNHLTIFAKNKPFSFFIFFLFAAFTLGDFLFLVLFSSANTFR